MSDSWYLFRTGEGAASRNMAMDEALMEAAVGLGRPVLRLYGWSEKAASFGYFQKYAEIGSWTTLRPLVRRPTGGGLVPHDSDWTYSLIFPPQHPWYGTKAEESYRRAHDWIVDSFTELRVTTELSQCCAKELPGRCFIGAEKFDVLANGEKIAGAAQKRNKMGLLIQGSIQPARRDWKRASWEESFLRSAERKFGTSWSELKPSTELLARAESLNREKYSLKEYNERR